MEQKYFTLILGLRYYFTVFVFTVILYQINPALVSRDFFLSLNYTKLLTGYVQK